MWMLDSDDFKAQRRAYQIALRQQWTPEQRQHHLDGCKQWHAEHPGYSTIQGKRFRETNPESRRISQKKWRDKNPRHILAKLRERQLKIKQRLPVWANLKEIEEFYINCPSGYHVDHIIPLQGKQVSGLHCRENLQYLSAIENIRKHNKFEME